MTRETDRATTRSLAIPLIALAGCVFLWPAILTFDAGDWPSPNQYPHNTPSMNACGVVGAWFAYQFHHYLGAGAYPLLLAASLAALARAVRSEIGQVGERAFGLALLTACTCASAHLIQEPSTAALPVGSGGVIGFALGELLTSNLSRTGTAIVLVAGLFVGLVFVTDGLVFQLPSALKRLGRALLGAVAAARRVAAARPLARPAVSAAGVSAAERAAILTGDPSEPGIEISTRRGRRGFAGAARKQRRLFDEESAEEVREGVGEGTPCHKRRTAAESAGAQRGSRADALEQREAAKLPKPARGRTEPVVNFPSPERAALAEPYPRQIENWRLPALSLLRQTEYGFTAKQEALVREQALVLEQTLEEFRLDARVVEIDTGPVITMFELKLGVGIKVSQIAALSNDIARALKAHAIRVVAPISGKNTVGIEVPNQRKERVRLKELITLAGKQASGMQLPLFLGKDAGGKPLVEDLTQMPHLLIAGTTGSGKSVCLSAIIMSVVMTKRPDHVKMILIDPKMVEMNQFKDMPHLMCPIVTDMARAQKILEWAVAKMDERYELLAEVRVKNISAYNRLGGTEIYARLKPGDAREKARISTHLPYIVIFIDELADLMMTSAKEMEHYLSRLSQKSRAVGVHIIVATQRPEAKVITGLIKSNLPSRICFRVSSRIDSRIVLDQNGGEVLLGQGDMLFLPPGGHKLIRAQGTFMDESEVQAVLSDLSSRARPEFHPQLVQVRPPGSEESDEARDPLFDQAVRIVLESKRGSVSLLQRRLTVGYARASRLIEQMAQADIVGDYKGSQAREVAMTVQEWDALQARVAADRQ